MVLINDRNHSPGLGFGKTEKNDNTHSRSCEELSMNIGLRTGGIKNLSLYNNPSEDNEYLKYNNSLSFSTCSSASTNLNFEELSNRLKEIKDKQGESSTFNIADMLSECICKEEDMNNKTVIDTENQNTLYGNFISGLKYSLEGVVDKKINDEKSDEKLKYNEGTCRDKSTQTASSTTSNVGLVPPALPEGMIIYANNIVIKCKGVKLILTTDKSK